MNKQIEEMAKDIYEQKSCDTSFEENCKLLAYDLVTLGYQKVDKDKQVVLTKEEYDNLKLEIQQAHNKGVRTGFDLTKYKENSIEQARKETAREILQEFYIACEDDTYGQVVVDFTILENIAKQYGVDLGEEQ